MTPDSSPQPQSLKKIILPAIALAAILLLALPFFRGGDSPEVKITQQDDKSGSSGRSGGVGFSSGGGENPSDDSGKGSQPGVDPNESAEDAPETDPNLTFTKGIVVDRSDKPIGGVELLAFPTTPNLGNTTTSEEPFKAKSRPNGTFTFRKVPKSPPRVLRITTAFGGDWSIEKVVEARPGDVDVKVVVVPTFSSGRIYGRVVDGENGPGVPDIEVRLQDLVGKAGTLTIISDASGAFEFKNLRTGAFRFLSPTPESGKSLRDILDPMNPENMGSAASLGVVPISEQIPSGERILVLGGSLKVSGKVVDDMNDQGVGGVTLEVVEGTGDGENIIQTGIVSTSAGDGTFTFENCAAAIRPGFEGSTPMVGLMIKGEAHILVTASGGASASMFDAEYQVYWLSLSNEADAEVKDVELRVNRAVKLDGIVSYRDGRPYEGAEVFSTRAPSVILQSPSLIRPQMVTLADGKFSMTVSPYMTSYAGARTSEGGIFFSEAVPIGGAGAQTKIIIDDDQPVDGLVLDQGGEPVEGAEVSLTIMGGERISQITSNAEGRFTFKRPGGSRTVVQAIKEGFFPSEIMEANRYESGVPIILVLAEPANLRGRVVDEGGLPVQGAELGLFGDGSSDFDGRIPPTGPDGVFEFGPLRKGKSYSALVAKGNIDVAAYGLVAGGEEKTIVLKLEIVLNCKIIAKNALGEPVPVYSVIFHPAQVFPVDRNPSGSGPWFANDESGVLELKLAPNTDFFFEVTAEGIGSTTSHMMMWDYAASQPNVNQLVFEFPVVIGSQQNVSGRVVSQSDPTKGLGGLSVSLVPLSATLGSGPSPVTTGPDGTFTFGPALTGGYRFVLEGPNRTPLNAPFSFTTPEEAALGDIPYYGLGSLTARVTNADGTPASQVWIELSTDGSGIGFAPNQQTDGDGKIIWTQLAEGRYNLRLPTQNRSTPVEVLPDQEASVDITLGSFSSSVSVLYRGNPIQNAVVILEPASGGPTITALTDPNGLANLTGLSAGEYSARATWPVGFFSAQGIYSNPFIPPSQTLSLQGNPEEPRPTLVFVMPSGMIAGAVTEEYTPSPDNLGPVLELYLNGDRTKRLITRPDVLGFFFLPGLPPGNWQLEFTSDISNSVYQYALNDGQEILDLVLPETTPQTTPQTP